MSGIENVAFSKTFVCFIENRKNPELEYCSEETKNNMFYKLFFRDAGETFEHYFRNNILYSLIQNMKNVYNDEIERNFQRAKFELQIIYYKYPKHQNWLFEYHNSR